MRTLSRVLLCMRSDSALEQIRQFLTLQGFPIAGICNNGAEAIRFSTLQKIDIAIVGFSLPDMTGISLALLLQRKCQCGILLTVPPEHENYTNHQLSNTDIITLQKPVSRNLLLQALHMMSHYRERIFQLENEMQKLNDSLKKRNVIEKAKVKLMHEKSISENSAYRFLQKESMRTGLPLEEIAEQILYKNK